MITQNLTNSNFTLLKTEDLPGLVRQFIGSVSYLREENQNTASFFASNIKRLVDLKITENEWRTFLSFVAATDVDINTTSLDSLSYKTRELKILTECFIKAVSSNHKHEAFNEIDRILKLNDSSSKALYNALSSFHEHCQTTFSNKSYVDLYRTYTTLSRQNNELEAPTQLSFSTIAKTALVANSDLDKQFLFDCITDSYQRFKDCSLSVAAVAACRILFATASDLEPTVTAELDKHKAFKIQERVLQRSTTYSLRQFNNLLLTKYLGLDEETASEFLRNSALNHPQKHFLLIEKIVQAKRLGVSIEKFPLSNIEEKIPDAIWQLYDYIIDDRKDERDYQSFAKALYLGKHIVPYIKTLLVEIEEKKRRLESEQLSDTERTLSHSYAASELLAKIEKFKRHHENEQKVLYYFRNDTDKVQSVAKELSNEITSDSPPYAMYQTSVEDPDSLEESDRISEEAALCLDQTHQVMSRALDLVFGFQALTFEAKSLDKNSSSLLERFGRELFTEVYQMYTPDPQKFPGNGFCFKGFRLQNAFSLEFDSQVGMLKKYKEAWPWAAAALDDLSRAEFYFTRGFFAVTADNNGLQIADQHYSYIVFNEHFYSYPEYRAFLIPTEHVKKILAPSFIPLNVNKEFKLVSSNQAMPDPDAIVQFLNESNYDQRSVNLTWASNMFAGLSNGFKPHSYPYHVWERDRYMNETVDTYGHVHKSHILGGYMELMTPDLSKALEPLREAHKKVYQVATHYQSLFDVLRIVQGMWHRGETRVSTDKDSPQQLISIDDQPNYDDRKEEIKENPFTYRMINEALLIHNFLKAKEERDANAYPILCSASVLDYAGIPSAEVKFDTYNLEFTINGQKVAIHEGATALTYARYIWKNRVMPFLQSGLDIRFYDRRNLGS